MSEQTKILIADLAFLIPVLTLAAFSTLSKNGCIRTTISVAAGTATLIGGGFSLARRIWPDAPFVTGGAVGTGLTAGALSAAAMIEGIGRGR